MKKEQDYFEVLRKIEKVPKTSQRKLAQELGFSLGKLNYCLKALKKKGLVKLQNFQKVFGFALKLHPLHNNQFHSIQTSLHKLHTPKLMS